MGKKSRSRLNHSGGSSLALQKKRILGSPDWAASGLSFCKRHGLRWAAWERRLLWHLSYSPVFPLWGCGVDYSLQIIRKPWQKFETLLVQRISAGNGKMFLEIVPFVEYVRGHKGSSTLQGLILTGPSPVAAFAYAAYGIQRRWTEAEPLILSDNMLASPALGVGVGDILDDGQWVSESQAVTYARLFLPRGWPALEKKMAQGKCHPRVAYEYAVHVLQGPLPKAITNWLVLSGGPYAQQYLAFEAANTAHPSPGSPSSAP